jgi:adhesin transport system membrane fusion protein
MMSNPDQNDKNKLVEPTFIGSLKEDDVDFINDSKAALLNKSTPYAHLIIWVIFLFMLIFFIWACFTEIDIIVIGMGKVMPSSETKLIQSVDGGVVVAIQVEEGQKVKKGQLLLTFDKTRYSSDYRAAYAQYLALAATASRLRAEADHKNELVFPEILKEHDDLIKQELYHFTTNQENLKKELANYNNSYIAAKSQLDLMSPYVKKGHISRIQFMQIQLTVNDARNKLLQLQNQFDKETLQNLAKTEEDLAIVTESLKSLEDKLKKADVISPINGVVNKLYIHTLGAVFPAGGILMEIVPSDDSLLIQAKVKPSDIGKIRIGQTATVQITAYEYSIYGYLKGEVEYISATTLKPENKAGLPLDEDEYYGVNVRTKKNYFMLHSKHFFIVPGMQANVRIIVGTRTIMQYLLNPIFAIKYNSLGI